MLRIRPPVEPQRRLFSRIRPVPPEHLRSAAVVFAPHQDDETLGCGGTIILKRRAGAPLTVVFMTDGSTSHAAFMNAPELAQLRRQEAVEAAEVLGVGAGEVRFLDFPDGQLKHRHAEAVSAVAAVLAELRPEEVFVPYRADRTPDHEATHAVVLEAMQHEGGSRRMYEYPVWLWNQWPWVPLLLAPTRSSLRAILQAVCDRTGHEAFAEFQDGVEVSMVLEQKRRALSRHRSQMTRLRSDREWPTLGDVSGGGFLECFFQPYEIFRRLETPSSGGQ